MSVFTLHGSSAVYPSIGLFPWPEASVPPTGAVADMIKSDPKNETEHSFIVRFWLERTRSNGVAPEWRGVVEHVQNGRRRYFRNPDDIIAFILPYLEKFRIRTSRTISISERWRTWKAGFKNMLHRPRK